MNQYQVSTLSGALLLAALAQVVAASKARFADLIKSASIDHLSAYFPENFLPYPASADPNALVQAILAHHVSAAYPVQSEPLSEAQIWAFCRALMDREWISLEPRIDPLTRTKVWVACGNGKAEGSTPEEAILRCYIAQCVGPVIELA